MIDKIIQRLKQKLSNSSTTYKLINNLITLSTIYLYYQKNQFNLILIKN